MEKTTVNMQDNITTDQVALHDAENAMPKEIGAKEGRLEPTRYGDWELNGKCVDF